MLRPKPQLNLQNAREYFRDHLRVGDYYSEGQTIAGDWLGLAAERLGLTGAVTEKEFLALCEGLHPETGKRLTARMNTARRVDGKLAANRRIFHDFTISPPKSVSIVARCQDSRIVDAHRDAVRLAMIELEKFAETRIRKSKQNAERVTGNIVAACFQHDTSRALDPHLHTHCVVFNATFDPVENRWKALQTVGMYRAQKFAENLYFHELSKRLRSLGYGIENNARNFEISRVPAALIERFSKRHAQIAAEAERYVANGYDGDIGALRRRLAHEHRDRKIKGATAELLREHWNRQLSPDEARALTGLRGVPAITQRADLRSIVGWADEHLFTHRAVVNDYELIATALARGRGENFDLDALRSAVEQHGYLREDGTRKLISAELLRCELDIVLAAQDGRKRHRALNPNYHPSPSLSSEQERAARRILTSRDFITLFRGGAGTGKSHTLKEVALGLAAAERPVVVLAPQRQQVHALETDGLPAETLARTLATGRLDHGAVVILDEAGQVGGRDLHALIRLVQAHGGRLILSGDTRQHGAVAASDALRAIEQHAKPRVAVLRTIRRQNPALARTSEERRFIRRYRAVVKKASEGKQAESFDLLDQLGCVRELPDEVRGVAVAGEYLTAMERGESVVVVAQTWNEVHAVNDAVRTALHSAGKLGPGTPTVTYQPVDRSESQKRDPRFYEPGQAAHFLRSYGRFKKGDTCEIAEANDRGVVLVKDGRRSTVGYRHAERFIVTKRTDMEIAPGDRLQLKANGRSVEGTRLHNGELVTVANVDSSGALIVTDERGATKTLTSSQRLLVRGYAVTSYGSQGKTVDTVLFADAGERAATNAQQWYVTISRGRKRVVVFTPDKDQLRTRVESPGERELATEGERLALALRWTQQHRQELWATQRPRQEMHLREGQRMGMSA
ncbi:MobF family relaxase [Opitutus terrae]|uniref:Conjugative relaxase domain protein n=1 Tax=Opitutus terrae (strain DSM 11246 / JCM 15787 / PB90-1) TaxID=452637 RepID=B1ZY28_OPITP|nr:MobF family relaxase [Opitutus terrae]ACB75227.1 conjugative relaxase domain protein [Opitutus terrae PB90-1]